MDNAIPFKISIGEKYGPAMEIAKQSDADEYFQRLVEHALQHGAVTRHEAETLERVNLGYYAGYYDHETRRRVERLFKCAHPVFGPIADNGAPTIDQAFEAGVRLAARRT